MTSKIIQIENTLKNVEKLTPKEKAPIIEKAINSYKEICLNSKLSEHERVNTLVSFFKYIPDQALDILSRWRDSLAFIRGKEEEQILSLLVILSSKSEIPSHERLTTAVMLYNRAYINICYKCFSDLANDNSVLINYRIEACRYLFGSEIEDNIQLAQEYLIGIIETLEYPSDFRYKIIVGYISKTGISTLLNVDKIKVPYNEKFVYGLQSVFFNNEKNGMRERILSGQHMLDMECIDQLEKNDICETLLAFSSNVNYDQNTRADAADVILRLGNFEQKKRAREIITDLGFSAVNTNKVRGLLTGDDFFLNRVKTIYTNSQNVHDEDIAECVILFIEKFIKNPTYSIRSFVDVHKEICELVRSHKLTPEQKIFAFKALNRVSIDTSTFSKYRVSIAEIFIHVWSRVQQYESSVRKFLEGRFIEELLDMDGLEGSSCSSGYSERFVNVLSGYDADIKISWESQIVANISGRVNAIIRNIKDEKLKEQISLGMMDNAEKEDKDRYKNFITESLQNVRKEMYNEFVNGEFISEEMFDEYFEKGKTNIIPNENKN